MTLIRAVGRNLLASYFIASGVKAARKPSLYVDEAAPVTDKLVPALKKYAPAPVSEYIPTDTATLVRINGALQIAGGLALATGKGRRLGAWLCAYSMVPATLARHPFWSETDPELRAAQRSHFAKNVALLGGVILAARDTEGQPGLRWRTAAGAHALGKQGQRVSKSLSRSGSSLGDSLSKTGHSVGESLSDGADAAVAGGLALAGAVAAQSRKARKEAEKQAKRAGKLARKNAPKLRKQAEKAQKAAAAQAKVAAKKAKPLQKEAAKRAAALQKEAAKRAKPLQKEAAKRAAELQKTAAKQAKVASKQAKSFGADVAHRAADVRKSAGDAVSNVTKNIELGSN